jgi:putative ABC transport system permease protein
MAVTPDYGSMMEWNFLQGRDYSREFSTDSSAVIINQTAARLIGWQNPINEEITWSGRTFRVIGVIQDMIVDSPYEPVKPSLYFMQNNLFLNTLGNVWITMRLNPNLSTHEAIARVEKTFKAVLPAIPFEYKFIDQEYESKFAAEERIGKLATLFAVLATSISCLGLFGLSSFIAHQRTKEIGVRKILGASVLNIWRMLSNDFVVLVLISSVVAIPIAYYYLDNWLQSYQYRTEISWWVFAFSIVGALTITLLTVSYQAIRTALMNPVKSLRSE